MNQQIKTKKNPQAAKIGLAFLLALLFLIASINLLTPIIKGEIYECQLLERTSTANGVKYNAKLTDGDDTIYTFNARLKKSERNKLQEGDIAKCLKNGNELTRYSVFDYVIMPILLIFASIGCVAIGVNKGQKIRKRIV